MSRLGYVVAFGIMTALSSTPATAQWGATTYGVAEYDTNEVLFTLLGVSLTPAGDGIRPVVSLQGHRLSYEGADGTHSIWAFRPAVGLRNSFAGGSMQALVGYSIQDEDVVAPIGVFVPDAGTQRGVTLTGQYDHWGTTGAVAGQAIASYNFGGESLWARGRLTTPLTRGADGSQLRLGGEVALLSSENFTAWQPGALVEWHTGSGPILIGGIGRKMYDEDDDATYFKAEFVLPIF